MSGKSISLTIWLLLAFNSTGLWQVANIALSMIAAYAVVTDFLFGALGWRGYEVIRYRLME
ncbi:hypothetical protein [Yersinia kristensenii]|uniref:hypothetical protein n=1 Tax=Yersinia kristensenii TaxID=28152 RepID=UPI0005E53476|nr:hypothetical protein [Yersinia kristensenii]CNG28912.1 Uncharacterised protein [Yersinia kristensenii]CNJ68067.1 Uncharacterised protein [Yersinia kristensenii]